MALATGSYGWVHGRHLSRQHVRPGDFSIGVPRAPISCPSFPRGSKSLPKRCVVMVKLEIPLVISRPDRRVLRVGPSKAPSSSSSNPWNAVVCLYSNPVWTELKDPETPDPRTLPPRKKASTFTVACLHMSWREARFHVYFNHAPVY